MWLVLFDCDGTLVDSQHVIVEAMSLAFERHGLPAPPRERILAIVGLSLQDAVAALVVDRPDAPVADLARGYAQSYRDLAHDAALREPLFPGIADLLADLAGRTDVVMGVATGKSRRGLDRILAHHALAHRFATLQTADDAPSKPAPEMVLRAVRETGIAPARTVVVGDTTYDMEMARNAGAAGIGVAWGYHPPAALSAAGARDIVAEAPDVLTAIARWQHEAASARAAAPPPPA